MNKKILFLLTIIIILGLVSFLGYKKFIKGNEKVNLIGEVRFINLEGGFYGIIGSDGKNYYPVNLSNEFKIDGIKVKFEGRIRKDLITTTMWGETLEIIKINKIK